MELNEILASLNGTSSHIHIEQPKNRGNVKMRTLKKESVKGQMDGKKSLFLVELEKIGDEFKVIYSDIKGWGIGTKTYLRSGNMEEAANAYSELVQLIQL